MPFKGDLGKMRATTSLNNRLDYDRMDAGSPLGSPFLDRGSRKTVLIGSSFNSFLEPLRADTTSRGLSKKIYFLLAPHTLETTTNK
jgi:hypothetical protein